MKIYYATRDIQPTATFHFVKDVVDGEFIPDMDTPLELKGHIVSKEQAARLRSEFGKDAVSFFEVQSMYTPDYRDSVRTVHNGLLVDFYYIPALEE